MALCGEKMSAYMDALLAAFPRGCGYAVGVYAEVWAGILSAHRDYLRYGDILSSIIETNVSVDRLAEFKALYFDKAGQLADVLSQNLGIETKDACECILAVFPRRRYMQHVPRQPPAAAGLGTGRHRRRARRLSGQYEAVYRHELGLLRRRAEATAGMKAYIVISLKCCYTKVK